jgi:hypothetical protein
MVLKQNFETGLIFSEKWKEKQKNKCVTIIKRNSILWNQEIND